MQKKNNCYFYRGSEQNVLQRVVEAATYNKIDIIVRITSDCPIVDLGVVDQTIQIFLNNSVDIVTNSHIRSYPDGMDVEVISKRALKKSLKLAKKNAELLEHVTLTIKKFKKKFKIINLICPTEIFSPDLGLTLDEKDDYELIKKIIFHFQKVKKSNFSCIDIINLLKSKPNLIKINNKVKRTTYNA